MKWTLSAFHFLYFKNNVAHIKHNPDVSPKLRLQAALNAHFTVFFYSSSQVCLSQPVPAGTREGAMMALEDLDSVSASRAGRAIAARTK